MEGQSVYSFSHLNLFSRREHYIFNIARPSIKSSMQAHVDTSLNLGHANIKYLAQ